MALNQIQFDIENAINDKIVEAEGRMSALMRQSLAENFEMCMKMVKGEITLSEILNMVNIEQRMMALKYYGIEKLIKHSKAKLISNSKRGNKLYLIKNIFSRPAYFLKYECTSTGRVYFSGIDPRVIEEEMKEKKSVRHLADFAMAWKFQWKLEEYIKLEIES